MAKKDKSSTKNPLGAVDLVKELARAGGYTPMSDIDIMHSREKAELPILALNCIFGGGLPLGVIVEGYGIPASGKSSVLYQTLGTFQQNYPDGVAVIIDTEASVDQQRMKFMGIDVTRLLRVPAITLEQGFDTILDVFKKMEETGSDVPLFFLWDTIAVTITAAQLESNKEYSQGMMEKPKIIKRKLAEIMPKLEKHRAVIVILNQVMAKIGAYIPSTESGGGFALKHDQHLQLEFKDGSASDFKHLGFDRGHTRYEGEFAVEKISTVNIRKSKLSSLFTGIPIFIDIKNAGIVDVEKSFIEYMFKMGIIGSSGGWCNADYLLERYPEEIKKFPLFQSNFRRNDVHRYGKETPIFIKFLQVAFIDKISDIYSYQKEVCAGYRDKLYAEVVEAKADSKIFNILEDTDAEVETGNVEELNALTNEIFGEE